MNCLSWNCQGLGGRWTVRTLGDHIRATNPQIVFLMETRLSARKIDFLKNNLGFFGVAVSSVGKSGGLALLWRKDISLSVQSMSRNHIDAFVYNNDASDVWRVTGFYGEPDSANRHISWNVLRRLSSFSSKPWLHLVDFRTALHDSGLVDLGFVGDIYTWTNRWPHPLTIRERLDRACASDLWVQKFPYSRVVHMDTINSDHNPICIEVRAQQTFHRPKAKKKFRFEAMWLKSEDCAKIIGDSWNSLHGSNTTWDKLQNCSRELEIWSRCSFGSIRKSMKNLQEQIANVRKGPTTVRSKQIEKNLTLELEDIRDKEDLMWRQRSKAHWLKEGDKNTRFFHGKASARRKNNEIHGLLDQNVIWCEKMGDIEKIVAGYFQNIFTSTRPSAADIQAVTGVLDKKVDHRMNQRLLQQYLADEVTFALSCMQPFKSPGPDGLPVLFYQKFWNTIGVDVINTTLDFLNKREFFPSCNFTHIVLIPKCKNPKSVSQFRPISLSNVIYKIASKAIVNRLKPLMNDIICDSQSAFVPSRLITDNVLVAFEISHHMKKLTTGKKGHMALKLDMSKAYDKVEWNFIRGVMVALGFDASFIDLIMTCVCTVSYSFMINHEQLGYVQPERGIRQGDPLSPYLFLFCAEGLSALIRQAERRGHIQGVSICTGAPSVSHLLFADDTLIFAQANADSALCIKNILNTYGKASGQDINFDKSAIVISKNTAEIDILRVQSILPVRIEDKHDRYLGLPMVLGKSKKEVFGYIRDKIWERVQGWNEKTLSKAGKEILIKAVLQAIPTYVMGCFKLPKTFIHELETLISSFWWDDKDKKKIHWVKWNDLCSSKMEGGLGFRDLEAFNLALLAKQGWRIIQKPESLLSRILKARYFKSCDFMQANLGSNPSFTWRSILEARPILERGMRWRVGNGLKIRIWGCRWLPRPNTFMVSSPRNTLPFDSKVNLLIDPNLGDWNQELIEEIFWPEEVELILKIPLGSLQNEDTQIWHYTSTGQFSVRSAYHLALRTKRELESGADSSMSSASEQRWIWLWRERIPNKIKIFMWRAMKNLIPVAAILLQRHIPVDNFCPVCGCDEETSLHTLLLCPYARQVWALSNIPAEVYIVLGGSVSDWVEKLRTKLGSGERNLCWIISWTLWNNRNKIRVGEERFQPHEVIEFAKDYWARVNSANVITQIQVTVPLNSRWSAPPLNVIKLNFDGALADGRSGLGVVARNHEGECLDWRSLRINRKLPVEVAEASAAIKALELAIMKGWKHVILEGDCKVVIDRVREQNAFLGSFGVLVEDLKRLASSFDSIQVCHVRRQGNEVANYLAKLALN
ncbi:hypothetical protein ACJIZ3_003699 [Penstemon smallii]|uniref:Reverse transcriptase domain-containing protein n=1 Tax=Penstemon smallii TaxID=265156 RepID=A0ABD3UBJ1_9LAMI